MYNVIKPNDTQINALYENHLKDKIIYSSFSYDSEDNIGFVTLKTSTGKTIEYQLRNGIPMFIEFTGFGQVRYDIDNRTPNKNMEFLLIDEGEKVQLDYWETSHI
jgi:hypothetical protein